MNRNVSYNIEEYNIIYTERIPTRSARAVKTIDYSILFIPHTNRSVNHVFVVNIIYERIRYTKLNNNDTPLV